MIRMKALLRSSTASDVAHPAIRARKPTTMLGALGLAALVLGQSAQAAPTTSPFQRYINRSCTSTSCFLVFDSTPLAPGTRLDIDNVSCYLKSTGELDYVRLLALASVTAVGAATLVPVLVGGTPSGEYIYAANNTVSMTGRAGQMFAVNAATTGKFSTVACQISGQLVQF